MTRQILLDTCAALWLTDPQRMTAEALEALRSADGLWVSPITAWECGLLASRGRLPTTLDPSMWFQRLIEAGVQLTELPPTTLIASSFLPGPPLRDPADRIIVATARTMNLPVMTRDQAILHYAEEGHVKALPC